MSPIVSSIELLLLLVGWLLAGPAAPPVTTFRMPAATDVDCRASPGCRARGQCFARGGECTALTAADCQHSSGCQRYGACALQVHYCYWAVDPVCGGSCIVDSAGCEQSQLCKETGQCALDCSACATSPGTCVEPY